MTRIRILLLGALLLALPTAAHAQPPAAAAPTLSTEEDLRWQILQLEVQLETVLSQFNACQGQLGQWRAKAQSAQLTADEAVLKQFVEGRHHGYTWDPKTGTFSKTPDPPKEPAKKP